MRPLRPIGVLLCVLLAATALGTAPAFAQEPPPGETALVDQYKEMIPTASGPKISGSGGPGGGAPLAPAVAAELRQAVGEDEARRLEEVATSPRFGAPPLQPPDEGGLAAGDAPSALSAAVDALGGEGGGSLLPLLLALVFSTGALVGAAFYRRRRRTA